jgi:hypothetical protein
MKDYVRSGARFRLELPVHLSWKSRTGKLRRSVGTTGNISGSGVFISLRPRIPLRTSISFKISFPPEAAKGSCELVGKGRVVRRAGRGEMPGVALIIDDYQLRPVHSWKVSRGQQKSANSGRQVNFLRKA